MRGMSSEMRSALYSTESSEESALSTISLANASISLCKVAPLPASDDSKETPTRSPLL